MLLFHVLNTVFYIATNTDDWSVYCHNESVIFKRVHVLNFLFSSSDLGS